jgi:hypothetical protein
MELSSPLFRTESCCSFAGARKRIERHRGVAQKHGLMDALEIQHIPLTAAFFLMGPLRVSCNAGQGRNQPAGEPDNIR